MEGEGGEEGGGRGSGGAEEIVLLLSAHYEAGAMLGALCSLVLLILSNPRK